MGNIASPSGGGGKEKNGIVLQSSTFSTGNTWSATYTFSKKYRRAIVSISGSGAYGENHRLGISANLSNGTKSTMSNERVAGTSPRYGADLVIVELLNVSAGDTSTFTSTLCYNGCYSVIGYE